jgi:hypothetical protein
MFQTPVFIESPQWDPLEFDHYQTSPAISPQLSPSLSEIVPILQRCGKNETCVATLISDEYRISPALNLSVRKKIRADHQLSEENKICPEPNILDENRTSSYMQTIPSLQIHDKNGISPAQKTSERNNNKKTDETNNTSCHRRLSRDERLVLGMNITLNLLEIIHTPMEQFNDLLASQYLTDEQVNICRDIRRRGKNKVSFSWNQFFYKDIYLQFPDCCSKLPQKKSVPNELPGVRGATGKI